mmetsp:Transcript_20133/g.62045  ORF Transcript_20133/g.62045 Transcript_20133/m.62045 type:complete len:117 (-) Transcript_20133:44-394(-)
MASDPLDLLPPLSDVLGPSSSPEPSEGTESTCSYDVDDEGAIEALMGRYEHLAARFSAFADDDAAARRERGAGGDAAPADDDADAFPAPAPVPRPRKRQRRKKKAPPAAGFEGQSP